MNKKENPIKVGAIGIGYKKSLKEAGIAGKLVTDFKQNGTYKFERADSKRVVKIRYFKPETAVIIDEAAPIEESAFESVPGLPDPLTAKDFGVGEKGEEVVKTPVDKKVSPRAKMALLETLIKEATYTKAEICQKMLETFPEMKQSTLDTILSDGQNAKYNKFPKLVVVTKTEKGKIYSFQKEV